MTTYHHVRIESDGEPVEFLCAEDSNVLVAMERLGGRGIQVGCRGGGCGVCRVEILEGDVVRRRMSRAHVTAEDEANGLALSCRIFPRSDLVVRYVPSTQNGRSTASAAG
ncbi:MAG: 2Fe-2S iron-sulfur cluster binding domain-containing protein [Ilumatobacteraceae bacterium]